MSNLQQYSGNVAPLCFRWLGLTARTTPSPSLGLTGNMARYGTHTIFFFLHLGPSWASFHSFGRTRGLASSKTNLPLSLLFPSLCRSQPGLRTTGAIGLGGGSISGSTVAGGPGNAGGYPSYNQLLNRQVRLFSFLVSADTGVTLSSAGVHVQRRWQQRGRRLPRLFAGADLFTSLSRKPS